LAQSLATRFTNLRNRGRPRPRAMALVAAQIFLEQLFNFGPRRKPSKKTRADTTGVRSSIGHAHAVMRVARLLCLRGSASRSAVARALLPPGAASRLLLHPTVAWARPLLAGARRPPSPSQAVKQACPTSDRWSLARSPEPLTPVRLSLCVWRHHEQSSEGIPSIFQ
jgi:hypothetical protein